MDSYNQLKYMKESFSFSNVFNEELNESRTVTIGDKRKLEKMLKTLEGVDQQSFKYDKRRDTISLVYDGDVVEFRADTWGDVFKLYYGEDLGIKSYPEPVVEFPKGTPIDMKEFLFKLKSFYKSCIQYKMMADIQRQAYGSVSDKLSYVPAYYKYNDDFTLVNTVINEREASVTLIVEDNIDKTFKVVFSINTKGRAFKVESYRSEEFKHDSEVLYPDTAERMIQKIKDVESFVEKLQKDIKGVNKITDFEEHVVDFFVKNSDKFEDAIDEAVLKSNSFIAKVRQAESKGSDLDLF